MEISIAAATTRGGLGNKKPGERETEQLCAAAPRELREGNKLDALKSCRARLFLLAEVCGLRSAGV